MLGSIAFSLVFKALAVAVKTGFELRFTATEVVHGALIRCLCSFISNVLFATLSFYRTASFDSAVARWCGAAGAGKKKEKPTPATPHQTITNILITNILLRKNWQLAIVVYSY